MGFTQWIAGRTFVDGESAAERARKELLVPAYTALGSLAALWFLVNVTSLAQYYEMDAPKRAGALLMMTGIGASAAAMLPAAVHVFRTRSLSLWTCEVTAFAIAVAVVVFDAGAAAWRHSFSVSFLNVVVLDSLLVCACRNVVAKAVVMLTVAWMVVRTVLIAEDVAGPRPAVEQTRFSGWYLAVIAAEISLNCCTLITDFHFTRGFATSMTEQKALVEASVLVSEAAAVLLSRYETEATATLLGGPDGDKLPPLLRSALLQLVDNLAQYRPYLPQSCLPRDGDDGGGGGDGGGGCDDGTESVGVVAPSEREHTGLAVTDNTSSAASSRQSSWSRHSRESSLHVSTRRPMLADAALRKVSLVAVNAKSFLRSCGDREWAARFVRDEVEWFLGAVAAERGVVDAVSGDHAFANFNASRMCTTHKVSAARTAWAVTAGRCPEAAGDRTAAACSGAALCGDFGASELRRYMILGPVHSLQQCLDRVAAQLTTTLADETVGADVDVKTSFFTVLLERVCYPKCGAKPLLLWQLAGVRAATGGPDEWMYELERQAPNPHEHWNVRLNEWLNFGRPVADAELEHMQRPFSTAALTRPRKQSHLREAAVVGDTVVFSGGD